MAHLTRDPISVDRLLALVAGPDRGGAAVFVGSVRNHHQGRDVLGLEYSGYEPMAEAEAASIVAEAGRVWPARVALVHRLGPLAIGEIAVACVAAGAHRDEAFAACRYVIEEVKRRVPIWKRERYADGTEAWVNPAAAGGAEPVERHP